MENAQRKGRDRRKRRESETAIYASLHERIAHDYFSQALREEKILFRLGVVAALMTAILVLCMVVCAMAQKHSELELAAKLSLSLSFNTVAVIAFRQSREIRRWAADLLVRTQNGGQPPANANELHADRRPTLPPQQPCGPGSG